MKIEVTVENLVAYIPNIPDIAIFNILMHILLYFDYLNLKEIKIKKLKTILKIEFR